MTELKVQCDCGQKYKFDVEPAGGQMPFTVACPVCGLDGTPKANTLLQQMAPAAPPPAPVIAPIAPIAPAPPAPGRLKLNISTPSPSHAAPPPVSAPDQQPSAPPTIGGLPRRAPGAPAVIGTVGGKKPSFAMGLLGGFIGALVGAVIYFAIYKATGGFFLLRYILALGVGGLSGWLACLFSRGEGSKELGGLTCVFTIAGILAAQYFLTLNRWHANADLNDVNASIRDGGYAAGVKEAKEVVTAIPTGSDVEIRAYLAKQQAEEGQQPKLESISNDEVTQFRSSELTNYMDLASGKTTKEAYWSQTGFDPKQAQKVLDAEDTGVSGLAMIIAILRAGVFSMIAGAGLAYKLSTNA
ncbi:MAG TPA: hypothetical protein VK742_07975 [Candidatus Sulfotelmatobacter sp.]|jgi:hypothetical protein|nr:hypothetical protein [Candidatus Sulfotelmatobacter sp.]